ncbi:MAG: hypothetical protein HUJ69_09835 [Lachnospiraceae bacterium]|nr:hypothetical protein [Lachnospiraceae bacterium]
MDLYKFFNSIDMENHLRGLKYSFRADEAAWLVWNCATATTEEKHEAYRYIIDNLPDCGLNRDFETKKSVHEYLRAYMAAEDKLLEILKKSEPNTYYDYDILVDIGEDEYRHTESKPFSSLEKCLEAMPEDIYEDALYARVEKHWIDRKCRIEAKYSVNCELVKTRIWGDVPGYEEYAEFGSYLFECLWFKLPTPFKKGDIVCESKRTLYGYDPEPMVLRGGTEVWDYLLDKLIQRGDYTDMFAWVYKLVPETCGFDDDCGRTSLYDLEYYHGELKGANRLIKAMSSLLKGDISPKVYTDAYMLISAEARAEERKWIYDAYIPEYIEVMGLSKNCMENRKEGSDVSIEG